MRLYPAIDLFQGKVVRLDRGDFQRETVYSEKPHEVAEEWARQGAEWIHVVDLEGARSGVLQNKESLLKIRKSVKCNLQFGGGLRKIEDIQVILDGGIQRIVIGTKALDEAFFEKVLATFGDRVAVSLDVRDGTVQTEGWLKSGQATLEGAIQKMNASPLKMLIYTDIEKDGMLGGPNLTNLREILQMAKARVILSGGIGGLEDIERCAAIEEKNFEGVIIGKALYEKRFTLEEARRRISKQSSS